MLFIEVLNRVSRFITELSERTVFPFLANALCRFVDLRGDGGYGLADGTVIPCGAEVLRRIAQFLGKTAFFPPYGRLLNTFRYGFFGFYDVGKAFFEGVFGILPCLCCFLFDFLMP